MHSTHKQYSSTDGPKKKKLSQYIGNIGVVYSSLIMSTVLS